MRRRAAAALALILALPGAGAAQTAGPWLVRADAGAAQIHGGDQGVAASVRLGRSLGTQRAVELTGGVTAGGADERFVTADAGLDLRLCGGCPVAGLVGVGVGLLSEPEFTGEILAGRAAIEVRLSSTTAVRATLQLATHGGESGPHVASAGLVRRFGAP